jgi:hypothetical protein
MQSIFLNIGITKQNQRYWDVYVQALAYIRSLVNKSMQYK